jgi:tetratricopeptide (TPR) repeat protein
MASNSVFISYRRAAGWQMAQLIWQQLEGHGVDAFYDVEDIRVGRIADVIDHQLTSRPYFVPILTYGTLDRCVESDDWVRREIQRAIDSGRQILPITTQGFDAADIEQFLPVEIANELAGWKRIEISQDNFKQVCTELASVYLVPVKPPADGHEAEPEVGSGNSSAPSESGQVILDELRARHLAAPTVGAEQVEANHIFETARRLHDQGRFDEALPILDRSIELDGSNPVAWMTRAIAHAERDDPDIHAAVRDHDRAFELDPEAGLLIDFANREIQLKPASPWGYVTRALALGHLGQLADALADFDAAIEIDPGNFTAYFNRGVTRSEAGDADGALADFNTAVALMPTEAWPFGARGEQRAEMGDLAGAISDFTRQIELEPVADNYLMRAYVYLHVEDNAAALADVVASLALDPRDADASSLRVEIEALLDDERETIDDTE